MWLHHAQGAESQQTIGAEGDCRAHLAWRHDPALKKSRICGRRGIIGIGWQRFSVPRMSDSKQLAETLIATASAPTVIAYLSKRTPNLSASSLTRVRVVVFVSRYCRTALHFRDHLSSWTMSTNLHTVTIVRDQLRNSITRHISYKSLCIWTRRTYRTMSLQEQSPSRIMSEMELISHASSFPAGFSQISHSFLIASCSIL